VETIAMIVDQVVDLWPSAIKSSGKQPQAISIVITKFLLYLSTAVHLEEIQRLRHTAARVN